MRGRQHKQGRPVPAYSQDRQAVAGEVLNGFLKCGFADWANDVSNQHGGKDHDGAKDDDVSRQRQSGHSNIVVPAPAPAPAPEECQCREEQSRDGADDGSKRDCQKGTEPDDIPYEFKHQRDDKRQGNYSQYQSRNGHLEHPRGIQYYNDGSRSNAMGEPTDSQKSRQSGLNRFSERMFNATRSKSTISAPSRSG